MTYEWLLTTAPLADTNNWDHMGGWSWVMAAFGWLSMILIVATVVWLISWTTRQRPISESSSRGALDVLDERYARSEIDRQEYLERKKDLRP